MPLFAIGSVKMPTQISTKLIRINKRRTQSPITDFSAFKTIEDVKQVAQSNNYNPNWGNYSFELLG